MGVLPIYYMYIHLYDFIESELLVWSFGSSIFIMLPFVFVFLKSQEQ